MLKSGLVVFSLFYTFAAFGEVSFSEKQERIELLEKLSGESISMNIDAYKRELDYEQNNLSLNERAAREVNLLVEKIRFQVQKTYMNSLKGKSSEEAQSDVIAQIDKDIQLVAPEIRDEIRDLAVSALDVETANANTNTNSNVHLENLHLYELEAVNERSNYLNSEADQPERAFLNEFDPQRLNYNNDQEIISTLISDGPNVKFISSSRTIVKSDSVAASSSKVSVQLKATFLGMSIDAGPSISFTRKFKTNATFIGEGLSPIITPDGEIDFSIPTTSGKRIGRKINFGCDATLEFETDYSGQGGFSVGGLSAGHSSSKSYSNSVSVNSREIMLPHTIGDKKVNLDTVKRICNRKFLYAWIESSKMNIAQSLEIMMKDLIKGLHFSHPKTTCLYDNQCNDWFNNQVIGFFQIANRPRCIQDSSEGFRTCELRGVKGQNCSVYDNTGKRISSGQFEFKCDTGLECVKVKNEGWFTNGRLYQHAVGQCLPIK